MYFLQSILIICRWVGFGNHSIMNPWLDTFQKTSSRKNHWNKNHQKSGIGFDLWYRYFWTVCDYVLTKTRKWSKPITCFLSLIMFTRSWTTKLVTNLSLMRSKIFWRPTFQKNNFFLPTQKSTLKSIQFVQSRHTTFVTWAT